MKKYLEKIVIINFAISIIALILVFLDLFKIFNTIKIYELLVGIIIFNQGLQNWNKERNKAILNFCCSGIILITWIFIVIR